MQTMQQQRARFALDAINDFCRDLKAKEQRENKKYDKQKKEYKSNASSLPFMIKNNGLGQAAAFYLSKEKTHKELYNLLSDWLVKETKVFGNNVKDDDLLNGITNADMQTYLAAQAEAMIFLQWVKQFANAFMETE